MLERSLATRAVAAAVLPALLLACAPTRLPPVSSAGAAFRPEPDERRLWEQARQEEAKLLDKAKLYGDPLLEVYLEQVAARLNPPGMAANPHVQYRVRVVEDPALNAFAYPHGAVYVHTGLLARMQNEDQIATVLGHEMTHVENRHMLRHQRSVRNRQIAFSAAAVAGAVLAASEEAQAARKGQYGKAARIGVMSDLLLGLGLGLAFLAAVNGYGRDLEREADAGGLSKMLAAGYDPREAPKVYRALVEEHGEPSRAEAFFFGSHPRLTERIGSVEEWLRQHPSGGPETRAGDADLFARRIRPEIRDDARANMDLGRLDLAEHELARALAMLPSDPLVHFERGRLKLKRAAAERDPSSRAGLEEEALAALREAIRLGPSLAAPHREVGLLAYRRGDRRTACAELGRYLELDPAAGDARTVRDYVLELRSSGDCP